MGKVYETIDEPMSKWLREQHMFFVATAPISPQGLVNCSPKGSDSFRVLGETDVAYQDLTGSGIETIAHLRENGRIVLMFCSFEGPPKIVRLHGIGTVLTDGHPKLDELIDEFPQNIGTRAIIHIKVHRVADSCGYSVPRFQFQGDRDILDKWADNKGRDQLKQYRAAKNALSIDGLPGFGNESEVLD